MHVVGAGLAGLAASVTLAGEGRRVVLYEAGAHAGGRCRSFYRFRARRPHRQRQPPAALRQSGGALLYRADRRTRHVRAAGRGGDPVCRSRRRRALGGAAVARRACRGGFFAPRGGCRERGCATISRRCSLRRAGPGDTVAAMLDRDAELFRRLWEPLAVAALNTSAEQASAALFSASSPRRSDAARPRAGRCWRAMDYRKVSSIPRWIICLATAARFASAAG